MYLTIINIVRYSRNTESEKHFVHVVKKEEVEIKNLHLQICFPDCMNLRSILYGRFHDVTMIIARAYRFDYCKNKISVILNILNN